MSADSFDPIIPASNDGFAIREIEKWNVEKYRLIGKYIETFTQSMRERSEDMIYVDLTAGSGINKIKETDDLILGSPLIALSNPIAFSKYIFCERETELVQALKIRINKQFRRKNVVIFGRDVNLMTDKFSFYIPKNNGKYKVSGICLIDAFSMNIHFEAIKALAELGMNFLLVFSMPFNEYQNHDYYKTEGKDTLEKFMGKPVGELEGLQDATTNELYFRYLVKNYKTSIESLGYKATGSFQPISSTEMDLPFYYLGYFAQNHSAEKMWKEVQKSTASRAQFNLFNK